MGNMALAELIDRVTFTAQKLEIGPKML